MSVVEKKTSKSIADYDLMTLGCRVLGGNLVGNWLALGAPIWIRPDCGWPEHLFR